eukprot:CAMPEP_0178920120 /NCGR_PEP_ID=MMETSP0786-20121207/14827_1 /TAXON_ID=186022 /ORGANISM="Thalassionema frauenfeldii, Strain CCMP 1798" /LENGTH=91 /DNA_ID=CAMNT_0020594149 /DNA_START=834 /DNA_END=1109 /DNA_ORIENTATION=+
MEQFDSTSQCLDGLGLFLRDNTVIYDVVGDVKDTDAKSHLTTTKHASTDLSSDEIRVATSLNEVDIRFYEWAIKIHGIFFSKDLDGGILQM